MADKQPKQVDEVQEPDSEKEDKATYIGDEEIVTFDAGPITFSDLRAQLEAEEKAFEVQRMAHEFPTMVRRIMNRPDIEDKEAALTELANDFTGVSREVLTKEALKEAAKTEPHPTTEPVEIVAEGADFKEETFKARVLDAFKDLFGFGEAEPEPDPPQTPTFDLWLNKETNQYHWFAAYSNCYRDQDNPPEIISEASHKSNDAAINKGEWPYPELWLWHIPYRVGQANWHAFDQKTGFAMAAGTVDKGQEWVAEGLIKAGWDGVSHGMPGPEIKRDPEDRTVFIRHRTKEISPLPREVAANKLAFTIINKEGSEQMAIPDEKRKALAAVFGDTRLAEIESAIEGKAKEADEAGLERKEEAPAGTEKTDAGEPEQPQPLTREEVAKALSDVVTPLIEQVTQLKAQVNELTEAKEKEADEPESIIDLMKQYSAVGKEAARVDGRTKEAKEGPAEVKPEKGGGIMGIFNPFLEANQQEVQQ